jgi:hypothetical protein
MSSTYTLAINNNKRRDTFYLNSSQDLTAHTGYLMLDLTSLDVTVTDEIALTKVAQREPRGPLMQGTVAPATGGFTYTRKHDSVPLFAAANVKTPGSYGMAQRGFFTRHPTSKLSGHKDYQARRPVIAVNKGLPDGNALARGATTSTDLAVVTLAKLPRWPCDDVVSVVVTYNIVWAQVGVV